MDEADGWMHGRRRGACHGEASWCCAVPPGALPPRRHGDEGLAGAATHGVEYGDGDATPWRPEFCARRGDEGRSWVLPASPDGSLGMGSRAFL